MFCQRLQCWALILRPADWQVPSKAGPKDEHVTFGTRLSTLLVKVIEYVGNQLGGRTPVDSDISRVFDGGKKLQRKTLEIWSRPKLVTPERQSKSVSGLLPIGPSQALREVWRTQSRVAKILGYPVAAFRGMRNRSQRCSVRRQTSSRNGKPLCGSLGAFTDELKIQCGGKHCWCFFRQKPQCPCPNFLRNIGIVL